MTLRSSFCRRLTELPLQLVPVDLFQITSVQIMVVRPVFSMV